METFAERLSKLRKRIGFNQDYFASEVGVSIDTVRRWEGGKQEPRLSDLISIAQVLGTSINELVGEVPLNTVLNNDKPRQPKHSKKATIVIQQGNVRVEIPATPQGYAILKEKLKEVSVNPETTFTD